MLELKLSLIEPLCPASGLGQPGIVDRDIVAGTSGAPRIPGRRLRGVLRDEYEQLRESALGGDLPEAAELFGSPGRTTSSPIRIGDAAPAWPAGFESWLAALVQERILEREEVTRQFTEIRRQTPNGRRQRGHPTLHARLAGKPGFLRACGRG